MIHVEAANRDSAGIRIELGTAKLVVGGREYGVESPGLIIRKLSEFTWDFVVYSIPDFHPVLVFVDAFLFLTGPLYNRRLKKQLRLLSDGDMTLGPGECKQAILGFRGVTKGPAQFRLIHRRDDGDPRLITYDIGRHSR
jgi:hypothetical protein